MVNNKKNITNKHNKKINKDYIDGKSKLEMIPDYYTGEINPYPEKTIRAIALGAPLYFENNPRAMKIGQYQREKRIAPTTWHRWKDKYEWFKQAHDLSMQIIGDKREIGCIFKELDPKPIFHTQHLYDKEWADSNKYHADLKKEMGENKTQVVVLEGFGSAEEDK